MKLINFFYFKGFQPDRLHFGKFRPTTSKKNNKEHDRITLREHYSHLFHVKSNNKNLLFKMGPLFQQFIIDAFIKVESNNLNHHIMQQSKLRLQSYSGLMDYLNRVSAQENLDFGRVYILPSTHDVIKIEFNVIF